MFPDSWDEEVLAVAWASLREPMRLMAAAVVNPSFKGRKVKPVLPEGGRKKVVSSLVLMTSVKLLLLAYTAALSVVQEQRGVRYSQRPSSKVKRKIAAGGFGCLSDDELASLVLSPEGLCEIYDYLADPKTKVGRGLIAERLERQRRTQETADYLADPSKGASWLVTESDRRREQEIRDHLRRYGLLD